MSSFTRNVVVDFSAPTVESAETWTDGSHIILDFNENLQTASRGLPQADAFAVTLTSATGSIQQSPTNVQINEDKALLTLETKAIFGQTVQVAYTRPGMGGALADPYRNMVANFASQAVTNKVPLDDEPPELVTDVEPIVITDRVLTLSFDETLDADSVPDRDAFTVTVEGGDRIVQSIENTGAVTRMTLVSPVLAGDVVTVTYSDPGATKDSLRDLSGNRVENFGPKTAVNNTPPALESATVDGATMTLNFNNGLDDDEVPVRSAFAVTVEGSEVELADTGPVSVSGRHGHPDAGHGRGREQAGQGALRPDGKPRQAPGRPGQRGAVFRLHGGGQRHRPHSSDACERDGAG